MTFADAFSTATAPDPGKGRLPYAYQCRLACGPQADPAIPSTLQAGTACQSQLIDIPTGLGKTAAVVLAWLWNRVLQPDVEARSQWPRRLIYCLPMRTLVEQTRDNVTEWLKNLWEKGEELKLDARAIEALRWLTEHSPVILMGGEELDEAKREWDIHPEREAILIGTQDMLLSRALNRGYGMSRYRWPMHFALLNNDSLWVMDETQLMGVGVETSAQFDGFRHNEKMPTVSACRTWWMSATLHDSRLATVDHPQPANGWLTENLSDVEKTSGRPFDLITAPKKLSPTPLALNATTKGGYVKQLAGLIKGRHQADCLTLVVLNRVSRAREVYEALTAGKNPLYDPAKVALIHSRFRPIDRERHTKLLFGEGDRIVIATQAVEAGVDVSARLLITELAPWSSLVQRMGRCNRRADIPDAEARWVDIQPKDAKDDLARPYSESELKAARSAIAGLADACPRALGEVTVPEEAVIRPVIRRRDLVDLFDTTPDLCGQDLDVSRYIRDGEDSDVQLYWRTIAGDKPDKTEPGPERRELCRVSIGDASKFFGKKDKLRAWRWNPLDGKWEPAGHPRPGAIYLVDVTSGGYDDHLGWTGDPKSKPSPHAPDIAARKESYRKDPDSFSRTWQTFEEHTDLVVKATDALAIALGQDAATQAMLHTTALWHDLGKAHEEFQTMLRNGDTLRDGKLWAKSANKDGRCKRRGFRHELASAIAWLQAGPHDAFERDLVAYLIGAHHGKVRLSIRSLPGEQGNPAAPEALFARGIWDGDKLPIASLGELTTPEITLDLGYMRMGEGARGPSWLARTVALRDRLGLFHLAFLETLLRAADAKASKFQK